MSAHYFDFAGVAGAGRQSDVKVALPRASEYEPHGQVSVDARSLARLRQLGAFRYVVTKPVTVSAGCVCVFPRAHAYILSLSLSLSRTRKLTIFL